MKRLHSMWVAAAAALLGLAGLSALPAAEKPFSDTVGDAPVSDVKKADVLEVPFIFWGGDVATFLANGGLETKKDSIFDKQGLKLKLTPGDDIPAQAKNYLSGKSPFFRGTMSQLAQASEVLGKDPRTQPVVFLQLTWSSGDHMVARPSCKTLNDLKGKKIALQSFGPHVGMLDDVLHSASLKWEDITVVWTKDVTGPGGPAELFRKDTTIDACFAVTPDMADLTGGLESTGTGADKTVKGAHVLVSTKSLNHSIADVYACRKDFFDKNKETVEKFAAGYLKACEELIDLRNNHDAKDKNKDADAKYTALLKQAQDIWGKDALPGLDDVHGLILDASLVCLPGNAKFFTDKNDVIAYQQKMKASLDMAVGQGYAKARVEPTDAGFDYAHLKKLGDLKLDVKVDAEPAKFTDVSDDDKNTIFSFTVEFEANGTTIDKMKYEKDFQKAVEEASKYGHALLAIRGHVDPTKTLGQFVAAGKTKGFLRQTKEDGVFKYYLVKEGKQLDLADTKKVLDVIDKEDFTGIDDNPKATVDAAKSLSEERSKAFREAIAEYAKAKNLHLDETQFKSVGVGIAEPIIGKPKSEEEAAKNRRVEFRIQKVSPELVKKKDYNDI